MAMERRSEVEVTLSDKLLDHLYRLSFEADVPLRWLVAGLVCDTMESFGGDGAMRPRRGAVTPRRALPTAVMLA
jgi:hypothetical protein